MKSIMSCSSLSSIMRSLGLLLRVSTMKWCRSIPVESVYSTLDSKKKKKKRVAKINVLQGNKDKTVILNTPWGLNLNSGAAVYISLHFICFPWLLLWGINRKHTPLDSGLIFESALISWSSELHKLVSLSLLLEMFASGDIYKNRVI